MGIIKWALDFILHIDRNLLFIVHQYGTWSYAILSFVIFLETGFVVTPFLPGDSLLFAAGSLAALGALNIWVLFAICVASAFLGDTVNYWVGRLLGDQLFEKHNRLLKKEHLIKAQQFYEKHGGFAVVLARFVPIVRTFAPCAAGMSKMRYPVFMIYNLIGGTLWVALFLFAGYFFGNVPFVKDHFELAMVAIILVSVVPIAYEFIQSRRKIVA